MTFTFELAERPLEAAVLTFARATKAEWRELAALLPDWDPAAPLVPPGCAGEKRELKELVVSTDERLPVRKMSGEHQVQVAAAANEAVAKQQIKQEVNC